MHSSEDLVRMASEAVAKSQRMIEASRESLATAQRLLRETAPSNLERMAAEHQKRRLR
jgi:hypothetical protein